MPDSSATGAAGAHVRPLQVALCGNPNTGKTTLFNQWTGANAQVGNYPGVTVERHTGHRQGQGRPWRVHDLPGCYSLTAHSPEEEVAFLALRGGPDDPPPDVAVVVLDATNLARNLFLLVQVAELGVPVVAALNLMDAAQAAGWRMDIAGLQAALGCPAVPVVARTGQGLAALAAAVEAVAAHPDLGRGPGTAWSLEVQTALRAARSLDPVLADASDGVLAWILAAEPPLVDRWQPGLGARAAAASARDPGAAADVRRRLIHDRYRRIDAWVAAHVQPPAAQGRTASDRVDDVMLHPLWGTAVFLVAMTLLFQAVFAWATPMADGVNAAMGWVADQCRDHLSPGLGRDVLVDGVLAGVGGTLVFLPQILVLFLGIALLEDSGYLARAAFLVDRAMGRAGLPGKAFVPLLSSYACAVPGILATRTLGDPRDRLLTILIAPLMSCSARLPVYTMVTAAVFADVPKVGGVLALGGLVVAAMYLLSFVVALAVGAVLRRTLVPGGGAPLLLEMPPYRLPRARNLVRVLWDRGRVFVVETGATIVALSVVLWALMTFPRLDADGQAHAATVARIEQTVAAGTNRAEALAQAEIAAAQVRLDHSIAGRLGHALEPAIAPLGFDWRIGIGLVGSLAAREVLVPVMAQIYGRASSADVDDRFAADVGQTMARAGSLTPLKGLSLMVFFAIAMQCLNTLATMRRETRSWRWPLFALGYLNALAWVGSFAVYQCGSALGYR
ncbi:MAG: ferrous iron transport protein B [Deltaproteobacteria bacterium]|nr:ferrous iron transport protein B [Deltaproteobacteria bacterium]